MRVRVVYRSKSSPERLQEMSVDARESRCAGIVITPTVMTCGVEPRGFYRVRLTHLKSGRDVIGGKSLKLEQARMIAGVLAESGVDFTSDSPYLDAMPKPLLEWFRVLQGVA